MFKFIRNSNVIYEGPVESMKHEKETVSTASTNTEVGIVIGNKEVRFQEDDQVIIIFC